MIESLVRDSARSRARSLCREGWATLSEQELGDQIAKFAIELHSPLLDLLNRQHKNMLEMLNRQITPTTLIAERGAAPVAEEDK